MIIYRRQNGKRYRFVYGDHTHKASEHLARTSRAVALYKCERCGCAEGVPCRVRGTSQRECAPHAERVRRASRWVKPMDIAVAHTLLMLRSMFTEDKS